MDLTARNVIESLSEIAPYIEADGGFVEFVEIEEETKFVKVRLGGACTSCAMSAMTLKQGIENKILQDIPDCNGVIQVLEWNLMNTLILVTLFYQRESVEFVEKQKI